MRFTTGTLFLTVVAASAVVGQRSAGQIDGTVVDARGVGVGGVRLFAGSGAATFGMVVTATSDAKGRFHLVDVPAGESALFTAKEESGYPDTRAAIFVDDDSEIARVTLTDGEVIHDLQVSLPRQCGIVTGVVRDVDTGQPIRTAVLRLSRADKPDVEYSQSIDGEKGFVVALPNRPFSIQIDAPGYNSWNSSRDPALGPAGILQLRSDARLRLHVRMSRKK